jgi:hypothetical protein
MYADIVAMKKLRSLKENRAVTPLYSMRTVYN